MIVYRVICQSDTDGSAGDMWFARRSDALRAGREYRDQDDGLSFEIEKVTTRVTAAGILEALSSYASHPNNG